MFDEVETRDYIYLFEFKRDDTAVAALKQIFDTSTKGGEGLIVAFGVNKPFLSFIVSFCQILLHF